MTVGGDKRCVFCRMGRCVICRMGVGEAERCVVHSFGEAVRRSLVREEPEERCVIRCVIGWVGY